MIKNIWHTLSKNNKRFCRSRRMLLIDWSCVCLFGYACLTGLIAETSWRGDRACFSLCSEPVVRKQEAPPVSWCLSSRCRVNGHEPHVSEIIKVKWRRAAEKMCGEPTPKRGSTSQNYYSIHVQPDLNSLDFSIYLVSIGPSWTKNTMACLTLAHAVIVCAQQAFTPRCFSDGSAQWRQTGLCIFSENYGSTQLLHWRLPSSTLLIVNLSELVAW